MTSQEHSLPPSPLSFCHPDHILGGSPHSPGRIPSPGHILDFAQTCISAHNTTRCGSFKNTSWVCKFYENRNCVLLILFLSWSRPWSLEYGAILPTVSKQASDSAEPWGHHWRALVKVYLLEYDDQRPEEHQWWEWQAQLGCHCLHCKSVAIRPKFIR